MWEWVKMKPLSQTNLCLYVSAVQVYCLQCCGKRINCSEQANSPFPTEAPLRWLSGERVSTHDLVVVSMIPGCGKLSFRQEQVRKVVGGFGKKSCVSTGVRKPGNTCALVISIYLSLLPLAHLRDPPPPPPPPHPPPPTPPPPPKTVSCYGG